MGYNRPIFAPVSNLDFTRVLKEKSDNDIKEINRIPLSPLKPYSGREIKPLEFKRLEITKVTRGLDDFLAAMNRLEKDGLEMDLKIVILPKGKAFSTFPDMQRRTCAVVFTNDVYGKPCIILEPARTENWRVSTLFVWPKELDYEKTVSDLLEHLVKHVGHWDLNGIESFKHTRFDTLKHVTGQRIERWAKRIGERLGYLSNYSA